MNLNLKPIKLSRKQKLNIVETKELSLVKREIHSFSQIDIPTIITKLDVSSNSLTDFAGFEPTDNLTSLVMDDNPLVSFYSFPDVSSIQNFSAKNTPLSKLPKIHIF